MTSLIHYLVMLLIGKMAVLNEQSFLSSARLTQRLLVIFLCGLVVVVGAEEAVTGVDIVTHMVGLMEEAGELATVGHVAQHSPQLPSND
jgi:uncharacterized membrane protein